MLFAGTQMHIVTFIFTALEIVMLMYQSIYFLARPSDRSRLWYLILLLLLINYNITGGLFPDAAISVPIVVQNILAYGSGFVIAMYFPFYFYKAFDLERMKFHAYYGVFVFFLLPYLFFFVVVYGVTKDLDFVRKVGVIVPFFYSLSLLYSLTKAIMHKYRQNKNAADAREIAGYYLACVPWMSLTVITYFNGSQALEVSCTNTGILVLSALYIRRTITQSRAEYNQLLQSKRELQELNASLTEKVKERTMRLEKINEEKTNTFINLAHETKTPLTLINNYLEEYMATHEVTKELKIVKTNIDKLSSDVINFFDLERLEKGFHMYDHEQIADFSQILKDNLVLFKFYCEKKKIQLIDKIEVQLLVKADPAAINRIVNNLIENAIKFAPEEGRIQVELTPFSNHNTICFSVSDNGMGITRNLHSKIFEPYFQINSEKRTFQGMGLGLPIVKGIVDSLHGQIRINSNPEKQPGTQVVVLLNRHLGAPENVVVSDFEVNNINLSLHTVNFQDSLYNQHRQTILIVEDNIEMLHYLVMKLGETYNVYTAFNGVEALRKMPELVALDLIISDVMMDLMDGYHFAELVSQDDQYNYIPFLFITAKTTIKDKLLGLNLGAIDFIPKPFSTSELLQKIESILELMTNQKRAVLERAFNVINTMANGRPAQVTTPTPEEIKNSFEKNCKLYSLTAQEIEIIKLMAEGFTYKKTGEMLHISELTVKTHVQNTFKKVRVQNKLSLLKKLNY